MSPEFSIYIIWSCGGFEPYYPYSEGGDVYRAYGEREHSLVLQKRNGLCSRCRLDSTISIKVAATTLKSLLQVAFIDRHRAIHTTRLSYDPRFSKIWKTSVIGGAGSLYTPFDGAPNQFPTIPEAEFASFERLVAKSLHYMNHVRGPQLDIGGLSNKTDTAKYKEILGELLVHYKKTFPLGARIEFKLARQKRTNTGCSTCRQRRIRYGEERPSCNNCIKLKRSYNGYAPRLVFKQVNVYLDTVTHDNHLPSVFEFLWTPEGPMTILHRAEPRNFLDGAYTTPLLEYQDLASTKLTRIVEIDSDSNSHTPTSNQFPTYEPRQKPFPISGPTIISSLLSEPGNPPKAIERDVVFGSPVKHYYPWVQWAITGFSYILEPPLEKGKKRIRWTCRCGRQLFDDFQELRPGAANELEQRLNRNNGVLERNSTGSDGALGACNSRSSTISNISNSTWLPWNWAQQSSPSLPLHQKQDQPNPNTLASEPRRPEDLFLLLCIPHRKHATRLIHMDVCTLQSDQMFFPKLKAHYHEIRGRWSSIFSLTTLNAIKFVQFEMYKSELVDIRKTNDIPPETKKDEYRYRPIPAEVIPPVGENHLMHLYEHPEDAEDSGVCLQKIPKKIRGRLLVCPSRGTGLGWGIHFVEGLHWTKLWCLGLAGFLLSIAFGATWSVIQKDLQGGFGVTACMMVMLTFTMGVLQAAFEPR